VLITSRKLRHYFQEYSISIITDCPLGEILRNQDATGRISKWTVELGALNINFKPRTAIKSQALIDFMAEISFFKSLSEPNNSLVVPPETLILGVSFF
jgi:hypothetical protein